MSKYEKLDAEIMKEIGAGRNTFSTMRGLVWELARQVGRKNPRGYVDEDRVVDRRLQALRKRGALHYKDKRWSVCARRGNWCGEECL